MAVSGGRDAKEGEGSSHDRAKVCEIRVSRSILKEMG